MAQPATSFSPPLLAQQTPAAHSSPLPFPQPDPRMTRGAQPNTRPPSFPLGRPSSAQKPSERPRSPRSAVSPRAARASPADPWAPPGSSFPSTAQQTRQHGRDPRRGFRRPSHPRRACQCAPPPYKYRPLPPAPRLLLPRRPNPSSTAPPSSAAQGRLRRRGPAAPPPPSHRRAPQQLHIDSESLPRPTLLDLNACTRLISTGEHSR